jgi:hypothetical protein
VEDVLNGDPGKQFRIGSLSAEQFWQRAKTSWNIQESSEALSHLWCSGYRPIEGTLILVDRLKSAGHELLYLSDYIDDKPAYLEPAKDLGMEVIAFKKVSQLEADLKQLAVLE